MVMLQVKKGILGEMREGGCDYDASDEKIVVVEMNVGDDSEGDDAGDEVYQLS